MTISIDRWTCPCLAASFFLGKPDAGNPPVRFDEWRGGQPPRLLYSVIFLSFLSFYRAAGLAWIRRGRWPASFPLFYRAVGLGPDLFDFSPRLDERRLLLRRTNNRVAQRTGSQMTTMPII